MHGLNPFQQPPVDLFTMESKRSTAERAEPDDGFCTLFGNRGTDAPLPMDLLRELSLRITAETGGSWNDKLPIPGTGAKAETWENPAIPSGYTYFLQFIAHDIVASEVSQSISRDAWPFVQNTRSRRLLLDTLYGGGPDTNINCYELSVEHRDRDGLVPRMKLRLGPIRGLEDKPRLCAARDLGRGIASETCDEGRNDPRTKSWTTECFIADPRNDSHALMSQFTVLFHTLHNLVIDILSASCRDQKIWGEPEYAYRRFVCARLIVTLIYRGLIEHDVLPRIMDPEIHAHYAADTDKKLRCKTWNKLPIEFSHGAFRFGHGMVRDEYRVRDSELLKMKAGLEQNTTGSPGHTPVGMDWLVDWSLFFGDKRPASMNYSRRIGPSFATAMMDPGTFGAIHPARPGKPADHAGIAFRDYLSSAYAGTPSVPKLNAKFEPLVPAYESWKAPMRAWLKERQSPLGNLTDAKIEKIVANPPLPFFIQFEAAHLTKPGAAPVRAGGGQHLGPLGSCIIAEVFYRTFQTSPIWEGDNPDNSLQERIGDICQALLQDPDALWEMDAEEINSMAELVEIMDELGAFTPDDSDPHCAAPSV